MVLSRLCLVFLLLLLAAQPVPAEEFRADIPVLRAPALSFEELVGREYVYDIAFLWFDHLAKGRFTLMRGDRPGTFRAILEARTLGVAAWLTGDRVQSYVALMERQDDGRLRSLRYESRILRKRKGKLVDRTKRFTFDYENREVRVEKLGDDKRMWLEVLPMEGDQPPNDLLTAYFNFRGGYFGPLEVGRHYVVPSFNRQGAGDIEIDLLKPDQRPGLFPPGGLVARLKIDPEIFDSEEGGIYVRFDERLRPVQGIVENVIGLGDVRGILKH